MLYIKSILSIILIHLCINCLGQKCDTIPFDGYLVKAVDSFDIPRYTFSNYFYQKRNSFADLKYYNSRYPIREHYSLERFMNLGLSTVNNCGFTSPNVILRNGEFCFDSVYFFPGFQSKISLKRVNGFIIGPYILNLNYNEIDHKSFLQSTRMLDLPVFIRSEKNRQVIIYKFIEIEFVGNELSYDELIKLVND
jgi:hypothetical protein